LPRCAEAPRLPDDFEVGTWTRLAAAVAAVQHARTVGSSLEELYQSVETLCVHKHAAMLLGKLRAACDAHVAAMLAKLGTHVSKDADAFLGHANAAWQAHCSQMLLIRSIFLYLDRSFVVAQDEATERSIYDMGLAQFRRHFEAQPHVCDKVVTGVLELVRRLRAGEAADCGLLRAMVTMLRELRLYGSAFLQPFLKDTRQLYHHEARYCMLVDELLQRSAVSWALAQSLAHCVPRVNLHITRISGCGAGRFVAVLTHLEACKPALQLSRRST
jgi:cullin 4